jgi:ketosteroid isomerase-like protein
MSDQTKVDVSQQAYAAFGHGDIPALLSFLSEDVEWSLPGPSVIPWAGTRHGHEGVAEFFSLVGETLEFEQFEAREFVGQGDPVVLGYQRSFLKPTGRMLEQEWVHVYALRNGKIAMGRFFEDTAAQVVALAPPEFGSFWAFAAFEFPRSP